MALHWLWKEVAGEATIKQSIDGDVKEFKYVLYEGNAYLIFMAEWEENGKNMYNVHSFWADKDHMKRCLGLDKKDPDSYNMYNTPFNTLTKVRLNKKYCRYAKQIATALIQAFDNIEIEIYNEE